MIGRMNEQASIARTDQSNFHTNPLDTYNIRDNQREVNHKFPFDTRKNSDSNDIIIFAGVGNGQLEFNYPSCQI